MTGENVFHRRFRELPDAVRQRRVESCHWPLSLSLIHIFGGIGSIPGAMLGSLVLGQIESFGTTYISSSMGPSMSFAVLILVLLVRPACFFGGGDAKANRV